MGNVWVLGVGGVLVRADAIVALVIGKEGLRAECATGREVLLAGAPCSTAAQLALTEVIRRAGADGRTVVIMTPAEVNSPQWRWECIEAPPDQA